MTFLQTRRSFLGTAGIAAASLISSAARAEPPPETTTVRIAKYPDTACEAPKYVAADLLHAEGFTDVRYVEDPGAGDLDFDSDFPPGWINWIETGGGSWNEPWVVLAGLHSGCVQVIANESIKAVADLKGKRVGVLNMASSGYRLTILMAAYVGLDPYNDIEWIANDKVPLVDLLADGEIDAFAGFPPAPQEAIARKIGHSILNTTFDPPWSQYYCCMLGASVDFARKYPIATKRVVRAFLKATDICRSQPALAARSIVDYGITEQYDYALEGLTEARFDRWREFDPEDTMRFYALRMEEVGFIKSTPEQIIANGTNWQFFRELKRELKI